MNYKEKVLEKYPAAKCIKIEDDSNLESEAYVIEDEDDSIGPWAITEEYAWLSAYAYKVDPNSNSFKEEVKKKYPNAQVLLLEEGYVVQVKGKNIGCSQSSEQKAWSSAFSTLYPIIHKY